MKRIISLLILTSMMLHSASRLGLLSRLYEERHSIALTVGLIAEIPIASCSSDYDFNTGLHVQYDDENSPARALVQAHEINLFLPADGLARTLEANPHLMGLLSSSPYTPMAIQDPSLDIFQPPRLS
jgi:hypothetical protein